MIIVQTPKKDAKFYLRENSSDQKSVDVTWKKKSYYRPTLPFKVEPGEKWVDLGANIGAFTVHAAMNGAMVKAYEPQVDNLAMIAMNIQLNNVSHMVNVIRGAVVPDESDGKELQFFESTNPSSFRRHTLYGNYLNSKTKKNVKMTTVKGIGFSKVIAGGFDCVKMNIEGAEIPIIKTWNKNPGIRKMVFEYSFDMDNRTKTYKEVVDLLKTMFRTVKASRTIPLDQETYPYWPPNCYVFCIR